MPASCSCQCPRSRAPPTRWWSAAAPSAHGAPTFCGRRAWSASSWSRRACSARVRAARPRPWSGYTAALLSSGVEVAERVAFRGLLAGAGQVRGVTTSDGPVHAPIVVLTGGPKLAQVGALAGIRIPAGGVRHQVAVTEQHPDLHPSRVPMVFDLSAGLYWRPEEGGLLFGMSNPDERPGEDRSVDYDYLAAMRARLESLVPVTAGLGLRRVWAATIDYTPDHLPIIGPAAGRDGPVGGGTLA